MNIVVMLWLVAGVAYLIFVNLKLSKKISGLEEKQSKFQIYFDSKMDEEKKERQEDIKLVKMRQKALNDKPKLAKSDRVLDAILRELREDGVGVVVHNVPFQKETRFMRNTPAPGKRIFISYDDTEVMYNDLLENQHKFYRKYNHEYRYDNISQYIKNHYQDKEMVSKVVKEKFLRDLAEDLMDKLDGDNQDQIDEYKAITFGSNFGNRSSKLSSVSMHSQSGDSSFSSF